MRMTAAKNPKTKTAPAPRFAAAVPPWTLEERVHGIAAMAQRIDGYIRSMVSIADMNGVSSEVKDQAVTEFYKQMVIVEAQLARIHDELHLQ